MTQEDAFLQDILEHRDDDVPRRIYADWLLDHDDQVRVARGEFIHLQCDLARLSAAGSARPRELVQRERKLLEQHGREWGSLYQRLGCTCWEYRRGFVEGVGMPASAFLNQAASLFRSTPLRELKLYAALGHMPDVASSPFLQYLQTLDLERNDLSNCELLALAQSPYLKQLKTLLLWHNQIGDEGVIALAAAELPCLDRLDLSRNLLTDEGIMAMARADWMKHVRLLDLTANQIGDQGALALARMPFDALTWLDLTKNPIGIVGQQALRERFGPRVQVWN